MGLEQIVPIYGYAAIAALLNLSVVSARSGCAVRTGPPADKSIFHEQPKPKRSARGLRTPACAPPILSTAEHLPIHRTHSQFGTYAAARHRAKRIDWFHTIGASVMHWPADINAAAFTSDATLTVLSQHQVVRLARADTLTIDTTNGQCLSAVVLDHSDVGVRLDLGDGERVFLTMLVDESLLPPGENRLAFSRQVWLAQ